MPVLSDTAASSLAASMISDHARRNTEAVPSSASYGDGSLGKVTRYLRGDHDLPYMPKSASAEYRMLAERSRTNWLPLISDTFAKVLFVDGFRAPKMADDAGPWAYWQANGLDARQTIAHRGALEYGAAYGLVLPGDPTPFIRFYKPTRTYVLFEDEDAEWPEVGLLHVGYTIEGDALYRLYNDAAEYTIVLPKNSDKPFVREVKEHGLGVCPMVRYRERLGEEAVGVIRPLIPIQDRINDAVFSLAIALQYASFRQRWATGLVVPTDDAETLPNGDENPNFGKPIEPFSAALDRLWVAPDEGVKFGDFEQTEVGGHLETYQSAVRTMAAVAQTSPHVLLGDLVNLSADALAAAEAATSRKVDQYATILGESHEQLLRLAARAAGDEPPPDDAEVRWRDTEARSLAQVVDALGKMAQMLAVPPQALWEMIPGVTDSQVEGWKAAYEGNDSISMLAEALGRQTAPVAVEA